MEIKLPTSERSEMFLLGRMFYSINSVNDAIAQLTPDDFSDPICKVIFASMCIAYKGDISIEPLSILTIMENYFPDQADAAFLLGLKGAQVGTSQEAKAFIQDIKRSSQKRSLIEVCKQMMFKIGNELEDPIEIQRSLTQNVESVFSNNTKITTSTVEDLFKQDYYDSGKDYISYIEQQMENQANGISTLRGFETGYPKLDDHLSGFCKGHFIIVGARPGAGKTTFCMNLIHRLLEKGKKVGFFSLEMTAQEALHKLICIDASLESEKVSRGEITSGEFHRILNTKNKFQNLSFYIEDQASLPISQVVARTKRLVATNGIDILFVDYLGEIKGDGKYPSKQEEIQSVSKGLRELAKTLKIPIVCVCQLNRLSEKENRAPIKSDLRESGQIEADAHSIILLHKPSTDEGELVNPGLVKAHIVKNRFGKTGIVHFGFEGSTGKFLEVDYRPKEEEL